MFETGVIHLCVFFFFSPGELLPHTYRLPSRAFDKAPIAALQNWTDSMCSSRAAMAKHENSGPSMERLGQLDVRALENDLKLNCSAVPPAIARLYCYFCSFTTDNEASLMQHINEHAGKKSHTCNICSRGFKHKQSLVVHMRTHTGEKPFSCKVCSAAFNHQSNLVVHMRSHTGEKPFSCSICSSAFAHKSNLSVHMRIHHVELNSPSKWTAGWSYS